MKDYEILVDGVESTDAWLGIDLIKESLTLQPDEESLAGMHNITIVGIINEAHYMNMPDLEDKDVEVYGPKARN